jgi:hypothetical protein
MIEPQHRSSIYDVLKAPTGFAVDALIACTYSAALDTVLSLPTAMLSENLGRSDGKAAAFTAAELASLKRVCRKTLIFCQAGAIHPAAMLPPAIIETERMVHEVTAPHGGAFHPKLWLIRFVDDKQRRLLRIAVMSRNLTSDPSWDLALVAEGAPGSGHAKDKDKEVARLLGALSGWCLRPLVEQQLSLVKTLAQEASTVSWKLPARTGALRFHAIGVEAGDAWRQPPSDRLVVFSPFLTRKTIDRLAQSSGQGAILLSRADALDRCWPAAQAGFDRRLVLSPPPGNGAATALHAKALFWSRGAKIHAAIGSMNATCAATLGRNVEFMASFDCTAALGELGLDALLSKRLLGTVVEDYEPVDSKVPVEQLFDDRPARAILAGASLELRCERTTKDEWLVSLVPAAPLGGHLITLLPGLRYRLATMEPDAWTMCGEALATGCPAPLVLTLELAKITGFVVFAADGRDGIISFTLNLDVCGISEEERSLAALRATIPDSTGFEEFVRAMLGDLSALSVEDGGLGSAQPFGPWSANGRGGLLELLLRCAVDDPSRLSALRQAIDALGRDQLGKLAPAGFEQVWDAVAQATASA